MRDWLWILVAPSKSKVSWNFPAGPAWEFFPFFRDFFCSFLSRFPAPGIGCGSLPGITSRAKGGTG